MKNLSVLKPDMAVLGQDRVGLTPFGLLTQLFTREVTDRAGTGTGAYQPIALAFVEQGEEQEQPPAPQINLELELTVVLERLGRQLREEGRPPSGVQQRIVEQVLLREIREHWMSAQQVTLQLPRLRRELAGALERAARQDKSGLGTQAARQAGREMVHILEQAAKAAAQQLPGGTSARRRDMAVSRPGRARQPDICGEPAGAQQAPARPAGRTAPLSRHAQKLEGLAAAGTRPLVSAPAAALPGQPGGLLSSQMTAVPWAGGWTPRRRQVHPGLPPEQEPGQPGVGSILLPDVLRLRQQAAVEGHRQGSRPARESPLVWAKPGQDAPEGPERARQSLSRLVSRTLEENLARRGQGGRTPGAYGAARVAPGVPGPRPVPERGHSPCSGSGCPGGTVAPAGDARPGAAGGGGPCRRAAPGTAGGNTRPGPAWERPRCRRAPPGAPDVPGGDARPE